MDKLESLDIWSLRKSKIMHSEFSYDWSIMRGDVT